MSAGFFDAEAAVAFALRRRAQRRAVQAGMAAPRTADDVETLLSAVCDGAPELLLLEGCLAAGTPHRTVVAFEATPRQASALRMAEAAGLIPGRRPSSASAMTTEEALAAVNAKGHRLTVCWEAPDGALTPLRGRKDA